ncbi:MAG: hypothetical protein RJB55_1227 [Verrucomicrobiota bacterium]|jgi:hypothetical protein
MIRHIFIFLGTFALGAAAVLVMRTARHDPHSGHKMENPPAAAPAPAAAPHANSEHAAAQAGAKTVNTICAICGMPVDPKLPTAVYQGQVIGFGCRMCPPKFKADPDKYGPSYLRNERMKSGGTP